MSCDRFQRVRLVRRAEHVATGLGMLAACALALVASTCLSACLSATPPKTPNQRAVERDAPPVVVPLPPDAGRTPRPAP